MDNKVFLKEKRKVVVQNYVNDRDRFPPGKKQFKYSIGNGRTSLKFSEKRNKENKRKNGGKEEMFPAFPYRFLGSSHPLRLCLS